MLETNEYIPQLPSAVIELDKRWDTLVKRANHLTTGKNKVWTPTPVSSLSPNPAVIDVLKIVEAPIEDESLKLIISSNKFTFDWHSFPTLSRHQFEFGPMKALDIVIHGFINSSGYFDINGWTFMGNAKSYYGAEEFRSLTEVEQKAFRQSKALKKYSSQINTSHHLKLVEGLCDMAEEVAYGKPDPDPQY